MTTSSLNIEALDKVREQGIMNARAGHGTCERNLTSDI
jgi:hypothetical protein